MRKLFVSAACAAAVAALGAGPAIAGEITGNGKVIAAPFERAQSECSF
jgi:hypothetical protein